MTDESHPLRVCVVGCGGFGRNAYIDNVVENPDASLVALCDINLAQAETAAREVFDEGGRGPRPALYTDYQAMIDQESLNVVMVGTMADVRPRVAIYALNAGAHVLAAKPMAPSLAEAEEMLQRAKEVDRILMVGYNFRFRDDAQIVHRFIRDGGIGTPRFARAWSFAESVPIRGSHYQAKSGWRFTRQNGDSPNGSGNLVPRQPTPHLRARAGTLTFRRSSRTALRIGTPPRGLRRPRLSQRLCPLCRWGYVICREYVDGTAADRRSRRRGVGNARLRFGDAATIVDLAGRRLRRCDRAGCSRRCGFLP